MADNNYYVVENHGNGTAHRGGVKNAIKTFRDLAKKGKNPAMVTPDGNIIRKLSDVSKLARSAGGTRKGTSGGNGG